MEEFKDRLKFALKIRNIKPIQLAEGINVNRGIISQYLNGNYKPNQNRLYELSNFLKVNPAWLLGFDVPMDDENMEVKNNVVLDNNHILDTIISEKSKELTEEDKQKLINIIDTVFDNENKM
jgi:transcriptional regulator with XRE-family HTH domain